VLETGFIESGAQGFDSLVACRRRELSALSQALQGGDPEGHDINEVGLLGHLAKCFCDSLVQIETVGNCFSADEVDALFTGGHRILLGLCGWVQRVPPEGSFPLNNS
jgi:hypothetical protein